jgi:hypothetical protein
MIHTAQGKFSTRGGGLGSAEHVNLRTIAQNCSCMSGDSAQARKILIHRAMTAMGLVLRHEVASPIAVAQKLAIPSDQHVRGDRGRGKLLVMYLWKREVSAMVDRFVQMNPACLNDPKSIFNRL